jgi:D-sedoheptulose 7-phosphate isomerase
MLEARLQQQFFESADLLYQAAEPLSRPVGEAVQALMGSLTGGGKLLVAGGPLAGHFARLCVDGFERARPPLAAIALAADEVARGIAALGLPGDSLLLVDDGLPAPLAAEVVAAAHDKDMVVVGLSGHAPGWRDTLTETDVLIAVPHERPARVRELQLMVLHALAEGVDLQLLGELDAV